jgi:Zn-dependent peptidase ImmA (M78 family)/transcriptional regulator with XRE-family HTH domain
MGVDAKTMGQRIVEARGRAELTQTQLATAVQLDRTALAKIEAGHRRVSALELARLADALDMRIEWFVQDAPPAIVSRRNAQEPGAVNPRIDSMAERIAREVEFVVQHDDKLILSSVPVQTMPETAAQAEMLAAIARDLIGLSDDGPCTHLDTKVVERGLLVFSLDLGVESADAATVLLRSGGIALINGGLRVGRRRLALAHELGHYLVADDYTVDWRVAEYQDTEYRESVLDRFARALLLPEKGLRADWTKYTSGDDGSNRTAAVRIASSYRVDMATLARRLVELGIVGQPDATQIRSIRTSRADIVELDLVVGEELTPPTLPREYERAVLRLFRGESISSARALDLLLDTWTEEMLPDLPTRSEDEIWQYI